jgi:hypothetical protein
MVFSPFFVRLIILLNALVDTIGGSSMGLSVSVVNCCCRYSVGLAMGDTPDAFVVADCVVSFDVVVGVVIDV